MSAPMPPSLWAATAPPAPPTTPLVGDARTSVAVVGGGFTGLSTAMHLAEAGFDVTVLEANQIGWGASGAETAVRPMGSSLTRRESDATQP